MLISFAHDEVSKMSVAARSSVLLCQSCRAYLVMPAGPSDFPHSRQEFLDRDVINPQNGHILCDAKPGAVGVIDANNFETEAVMEANRLRKRSRNR
jgi:hypothetical protein